MRDAIKVDGLSDCLLAAKILRRQGFRGYGAEGRAAVVQGCRAALVW